MKYFQNIPENAAETISDYLFTQLSEGVMISTMGKRTENNSEPDRHKTPRIGVNIPKDWHDVARKLAAKSRQPVVWFLISMIADKAAEEGLSVPVLPWDDA